jgi:hypothetical protein|nr:MAG TPA_asm: hypothetical protein [Caudoviricetes sp.]
MVFSKDFKGQVKISEVKESLDNLVNGVNKQIDLYNTSDYVQDIDYNIGAPDLAPLNYTLSIGGLKKFLNAYNGCVVGCKAFNIGGQYAVTDGIMFLQDGCHRIPAQIISSLPKTLEYSPSAKIYKGQKEPPVIGGGVALNGDTSNYTSHLDLIPDTYGYIASDSTVHAITLTKNRKVDEIKPVYHTDITRTVTFGEDIAKAEVPSVDWETGDFGVAYSNFGGGTLQLQWGDATQSLSKLEFKIHKLANTPSDITNKADLKIRIPMYTVKDDPTTGQRIRTPLSNGWGTQSVHLKVVVKTQNGLEYDRRASIKLDGETSTKVLGLSYNSSDNSYRGTINFDYGVTPDKSNNMTIEFTNIFYNSSSVPPEQEANHGFHVEIYPTWCNEAEPITIYPKIEAASDSEADILYAGVLTKPVYTDQPSCGQIKVVLGDVWQAMEVVSSSAGSGGTGEDSSITDWIYICDLNPNRDIALSNTPNLAVCNVEGMYITSQTKNVGLETIEQRDISKAQFISGVPRDCKGAKGSGSRSNIVKLLGEYVARSFQRRKREAGGIAIYNKLFLPKGVPNPYTYEGDGSYGPNGQKTFDANVTRNS